MTTDMIRYNTTAAIIAARQDEALTHGQVMYGLIKPTKDMEQIESTAAMVNVIPKKRIYRMEKVDELDLFITELMRRPLVLQPSAHIGRGFAKINCAFYTREEKWILLINQVHGKIRGKIEIGVQTARTWMSQGIPFTLTISMNEYLKRIYLDHMTKAVLNPRFTFVEFTDAEIVIRYMGPRGMAGRRGEETFLTFDDLLPSELHRRGVAEAQAEWRNPALRVVMPDELNRFLPGWGFEQEDPFANIDQADDELEEGATGGVNIDQENEHLMPPGTARNASAPPTGAPGRVMGRAQRKSNQTKYQVPVELHVPEAGGPQRLDGKPSPEWEELPPPHYEDLQMDRNRNEHPYEERRFQNSGALQSQYSPSNHGQSVNSPHSPNYPSSPSNVGPSRLPSSPRTPSSLQPNVHGDRYSRESSRSPRSPSSPQMEMSRSPRTPVSPPHDRDQTRSPRTPMSPRDYDSSDRYNSEQTNSYSPRQPQQTYLTDDNEDDGGFSAPMSRSQPHSGNKYTDYNRNVETSRYGNGQYDPKDRYGSPSSPVNVHRPSSHSTNQSTRPVPSSRGNFPPSSRPVPAQRVLHHHQGSGKSDTTTSDSGFDDFESSRHNNRYNSDKNIGKAPYYNHAFEKDMSPEKDTDINDILAKHKAMAAKMLHQGQSVPSINNYHRGDDMYGHEVQKWRRNINELQEACDDSSVRFSRTANLSNHSEQEQVAESFI